MLSWAEEETYINWYDPATNKWNITSKFCQNRGTGSIKLIKHQFVVLIRPYSRTSVIIDLFSPTPCWILMPCLKFNTRDVGVGLINHCVYVVSYTKLIIFHDVLLKIFVGVILLTQVGNNSKNLIIK